MLTAPQRYVLPFAVLVETLRSWHEPLTLSALLPPVPEDGPGQATAHVHIVKGYILSCTIVNAQGTPLARQQAALTRLAQVGNLQWLVTLSVVPTEVYRPCRRHATIPFLPATLSRRHRQLLLLIDGRKSIPDLARVLRLSPHEVETLLRDLQQEQFLI